MTLHAIATAKLIALSSKKASPTPSLCMTLWQVKSIIWVYFFVGAYQETLGDLHNLFGDTNVVTIELNPDGSFEMMHEQEGDTVSEVLSYVEYDPRRMVDTFKVIVENAVRAGRVSAAERKEMISTFKDSIQGYTYFEH